MHTHTRTHTKLATFGYIYIYIYLLFLLATRKRYIVNGLFVILYNRKRTRLSYQTIYTLYTHLFNLLFVNVTHTHKLLLYDFVYNIITAAGGRATRFVPNAI